MSAPGDLLQAVMADPDRPCRFEDPETFFHPTRRGQVEAAELCNGCPVRAMCLEYALETQQSGVWGGMIESDREALIRRQRRSSTNRMSA